VQSADQRTAAQLSGAATRTSGFSADV